MKIIYIIKETIDARLGDGCSYVHTELGAYKSFSDARKAALQHMKGRGFNAPTEEKYPLDERPSGVFTLCDDGAVRYRIIVCGIPLN